MKVWIMSKTFLPARDDSVTGVTFYRTENSRHELFPLLSRLAKFSTNFDSRRKKGRRLTPRAFKVSISTTEAFSRLFIFMCTRRDDFSFALEKMINVDSGKSWRNLFLFTTTNYLSTALLWVVKRAFISCFCCFTCGNHQHKSLFFVHGKMI